MFDPSGLDPNQICVAACTLAGATLGGIGGEALGVTGGGVIGAILGMACGPPGMISGGALVGTFGGAILGTAGAAGGGAAGNALGQAMCPDNRDGECKKQWEADVAWCDSNWSRYSRKGEACHRWAQGNLGRCKNGESREPWRL